MTSYTIYNWNKTSTLDEKKNISKMKDKLKINYLDKSKNKLKSVLLESKGNLNMGKDFRKALRLFKYLAALFSIAYWVYIVIDDFIFIEKYWTENWLMYLRIWATFYLVYLIMFSCCFWFLSTVVILIRKQIYPYSNE